MKSVWYKRSGTQHEIGLIQKTWWHKTTKTSHTRHKTDQIQKNWHQDVIKINQFIQIPFGVEDPEEVRGRLRGGGGLLYKIWIPDIYMKFMNKRVWGGIISSKRPRKKLNYQSPTLMMDWQDVLELDPGFLAGFCTGIPQNPWTNALLCTALLVNYFLLYIDDVKGKFRKMCNVLYFSLNSIVVSPWLARLFIVPLNLSVSCFTIT